VAGKWRARRINKSIRHAYLLRGVTSTTVVVVVVVVVVVTVVTSARGGSVK
jgi:hypothetical protein